MLFQARGHATTYRPGAIAFWMGHQRRDFSKTPPIDDAVEYGRQWWQWWTALQPAWRTVNNAGRPEQAGTGPWDELEKPGKCGFLLVLLSLLWWRKAPGAVLEDWQDAVRDVNWVLTCLLLAERDDEDEPGEPDGEGPANRRKRPAPPAGRKPLKRRR